MDSVGAVIGVILGVLFLIVLIIYLIIRCCVGCCRCLFGSSRRGADYGIHPPVSAGTTYVVINPNQQPVPIMQGVPRV